MCHSYYVNEGKWKWGFLGGWVGAGSTCRPYKATCTFKSFNVFIFRNEFEFRTSHSYLSPHPNTPFNHLYAFWKQDMSCFILFYIVGVASCPSTYGNLLSFEWLFSGATSVSPVIASLCGREPPGSFHSTGDSMFIHFSSDSQVSGQGFNASYSKGWQTNSTCLALW